MASVESSTFPARRRLIWDVGGIRQMLFDPHPRVVDRGFAFVAGVISHMQQVIVPVEAGIAAIAAVGQFDLEGD